MHRYFVPSLFILNSLLVISSYPSQAQAQANSTCKNTINLAKKELQRGRQLNLSNETNPLTNIAQSYPDHPAGRSQRYMFVMKGAAISSILSSPQLMTNISTKIIRDCNTIGSVIFARANSGEFITTGLFSDGQVKLFDCAEQDLRPFPRMRRAAPKRSWGVQYCHL